VRRLLKPTLAAILGVALTAGLAFGAIAVKRATNDNEFEYAIGLWGDLPYNDIQATIGVPNLINDMNAQDLKFTVHDGDLKAGNRVNGSTTPTDCSDPLYTQGLAFLNSLRKPAMFTPGDNDWTDCDRPSNGGFNSLERLDHERSVFFSTPFSAGQQQLRQQVQTAPLCLDATGAKVACVENRRWSVEDVTYATINFQGSCNNLCDTAPDPAEYAARTAANVAWLQETFAQATQQGSAGVMIIGQADPGFDGSDGTRAPIRNPRTLAEATSPDGYQETLTAFRNLVVAFGKPVVYVHGDSHYFRVDKPLLDASGRRVENFTRVETYGDNAANGLNDVHWVKALVDPGSRDVFAFQPQVVPGNRTAVPAP
jgi:hypothetical protein